MKIAVGLSGGVDSSVAAYLLKEQGHDLIALFMQNWHDTTGTLYGDCPWKDDLAIAKMVAKKLDIPFHFVDLSKEYTKRVVDYMFEEYKMGRTPNPDILCNREIKFEAFLKHSLALGAECVATGHYAQIEQIEGQNGDNIYRLLQGVDPSKDQSYFLCQLSQKQLSKALFPIGGLLKSQVRKIALEAKLPTANKKDSQGICFVGKIDLPLFLQQKLAPKNGVVIEIPTSFYKEEPEPSLSSLSKPYLYTPADGKVIGEHTGAHFYTVGQRKGLNIGGHVNPLFVISIDTQDNIIYVGEGGEHPGLYRKGLKIKPSEVHWVREDLALAEGESIEVKARIRYRQPLEEAQLHYSQGLFYLLFDKPQRGITPGQFAAWYLDDELIGSGVIDA